MLIDYNLQKSYQNTIDIVDIGNTCLRATSTKLLDYFIIIKTIMGKTHIFKFGPLMVDVPTLVDGFSVFYKKIDYKEQSIAKEINLFINDAKKEIDTVIEMQPEEALNDFPNIKEIYLNGLEEL